jgi:prefoldin subunit 5
MTTYTLDNVIEFLKARHQELNRQFNHILASIDEVDKLIEHFEMMKKNNSEGF